MLSAGTKIGSYEIVSPLGAGGMGEVYRARDSKLSRQVALKVLPDAFARNPDRMARFEREARVLASLNHTHIATIFGVEDSGASRALVMELVEGPTLADRLRSGPIPIAEALPIARQICEALEYAHEHGVIHRDLKPANIKFTADDSTKVLDFGLAKAVEADPASIDIATSPTMSRMATMAGILLGTAAYMSPEQAKAKPVDRRADIWAFGCVLYEMLSGKMAFHGETVTDTLAAVIKEEPDWSLLPHDTPVRVRVLLQRCLQKDPKQRLQAIGDARIALEEVLSGAADPIAADAARPKTRSPQMWLGWGVAAIATMIAASLAFLHFHKAPALPAQVIRFELPLPERTVISGGIALSNDGQKIAFIARGADGQSRVWLRSLDSLQARSLDGTDGASDAFWSPDGRLIAFYVPGKLKKIESSGGPALTICDATSYLGASWNYNDQIVFGTVNGFFQVAASGGEPVALTTTGNAGSPIFIAGGSHFFYTRVGPRIDDSGIYIGSVDTKPQDQPAKKLLADVSAAAWSSSGGSDLGFLVFVRGSTTPGSAGTLMAQPFDSKRLELSGEAAPIADQVSSFSISAANSLVYVRGAPSASAAAGVRGVVQGQLTWFDRAGKRLQAIGDLGSYRTLALSPDGKRVAFDRSDPQNPSVRNLWLYEFARGVTTRFTFDSGLDYDPVWSPDGGRIAFTSSRDGAFNLYQKLSNLSAEDEVLLKSNDPKATSSWTPDGRFVLYFNPLPPAHQWLLPVSAGEDHKPARVDTSEFNEAAGRISPDGRWIAYNSDESGKGEIYVRPLDVARLTGSTGANETAVTGKWMVSKDGGTTPLWRGDGKELYYLTALGGEAMAVDVSTSGVFQAGVPRLLFKVPPGVLFWDVSPDGKRFIMAAPNDSPATAPSPFTVVLNWQSVLKK
jgi:eukaryotic-like serine/threonine-protein kinase